MSRAQWIGHWWISFRFQTLWVRKATRSLATIRPASGGSSSSCPVLLILTMTTRVAISAKIWMKLYSIKYIALRSNLLSWTSWRVNTTLSSKTVSSIAPERSGNNSLIRVPKGKTFCGRERMSLAWRRDWGQKFSQWPGRRIGSTSSVPVDLSTARWCTSPISGH